MKGYGVISTLDVFMFRLSLGKRGALDVFMFRLSLGKRGALKQTSVYYCRKLQMEIVHQGARSFFSLKPKIFKYIYSKTFPKKYHQVGNVALYYSVNFQTEIRYILSSVKKSKSHKKTKSIFLCRYTDLEKNSTISQLSLVEKWASIPVSEALLYRKCNRYKRFGTKAPPPLWYRFLTNRY
jgi:hypothetical protein